MEIAPGCTVAAGTFQLALAAGAETVTAPATTVAAATTHVATAAGAEIVPALGFVPIQGGRGGGTQSDRKMPIAYCCR